MSSAPQGAISQDKLMQAIVMDVAQTGGQNINALKSIYELTQPRTPNATQQQQANNALSGLQDLGIIQSELQRDPTVAAKANLPGGSLTQRLTGSGNFESARKNIGDVLARLRSGAAITDDEYKRYVALLPAAFDNPDVASQKLARLQGLLSAFANPVPASGGGYDSSMTGQQPAY